eukprot:TRINITY_DN25109_c0_g1_i1.p1 TRINITY_DN25109_c0_g1~~TRINITY_DN25109_c0_g1_i1.p1  ORF type:complete len:170 (+),score=35.64 TRINITY_DN25109_c0_g1_i1:44-553(+)
MGIAKRSFSIERREGMGSESESESESCFWGSDRKDEEEVLKDHAGEDEEVYDLLLPLVKGQQDIRRYLRHAPRQCIAAPGVTDDFSDVAPIIMVGPPAPGTPEVRQRMLKALDTDVQATPAKRAREAVDVAVGATPAKWARAVAEPTDKLQTRGALLSDRAIGCGDRGQ